MYLLAARLPGCLSREVRVREITILKIGAVGTSPLYGCRGGNREAMDAEVKNRELPLASEDNPPIRLGPMEEVEGAP